MVTYSFPILIVRETLVKRVLLNYGSDIIVATSNVEGIVKRYMVQTIRS